MTAGAQPGARLLTPAEQALHPFTTLPVPDTWERVALDGATLVLHPMPMAQLVEPTGDGPSDLGATVEDARSRMREAGRSHAVWWLTDAHAALGPQLEQLGIRHGVEAPGFEPVETAMVLTREPDGGAVEGVEVDVAETFEAFADAWRLMGRVFGFTPEMLEHLESDLPRRYEEAMQPDNRSRLYVARVDGVVVGSAVGWWGEAGINLFGGAVAPEARGRGIYRALIWARWCAAVDRGTPALTVQAGAMSQPILERLGFDAVAQARLYVDAL